MFLCSTYVLMFLNKNLLLAQLNAVGTNMDTQDGVSFHGERIRGVRKSKGKTLTQLAQETDLSSGYLSQIERGLAQPSINALVTIAKTLGVNIHVFFAGEPEVDDAEKDYIVRKDQRLQIEYDNGVVDQLLTPKSNREVEIIRCVFPPGSGTGDQTYCHKGSEALVIEEGSLEFWVGDRHFHLSEGDALSFSSTENHGYKNTGNTETVVYWFITPATF